MKTFKHIICPFDFSNFSEKALDYAIKLTKCSGEKLSIVHVMVNPFLFEGGNPLLQSNVLAQDLLEKIRLDEQSKLDALKRKILAEYPEMDVDLIIEEENDIGEAIIAAQQRLGADLIVIGSHGRKGIKRVFLGSVAESVLRDSSCPVLVVK
ncbi:MAG: universal stress protein [Saprospiraceae bacterium]|nr:universal stress protein [Saprospiraceae bacterium]